MRVVDLVEPWGRALEGDKLGKRTIVRYQRIVRQFAAWADGNVTLADLTPVLLMDYQAHIGQCAARTIALTISALKRFCSYGVQRGLLASNPAAGLKRPRLPKLKPRRLRSQELATLHEILSMPRWVRGADAFHWQRNRRCILIMLYAGLRLSEVCNLHWTHADRPPDVDLGNGEIYVVNGKGEKDRVVPISQLLERELLLVPEHKRVGPLICTSQGTALSPTTAAHIFRRWLPARGLLGVTAHRLRHTFANELRRAGVPVEQVRVLMGHEQIETTTGYFDIESHELLAAVDKIPSLAQLATPAPARRRFG